MQTEQPTVTIGYWKIRGLVQHICYLLEYTGTKYNFVTVDDRPTWIAGKPALIEAGFQFPNLPYIQDGDLQMSESLAITLHIAEKYGTDLLFTPETRARFFELWGVVNDVRGAFTGIGYRATSDEELKTMMAGSVTSTKFKREQLNQILGSQKWLMGDNLTAVDFLFAEAIERLMAMAKDTGVQTLEGLDNLVTYFNNFIALEPIKAFRESENFMAKPWNNTQAHWK
jgi:glutathione S-transferase